MGKKAIQNRGEYVKKKTLYLVSFLALAVGFFGGAVFGVFRSDSSIPGQPITAGTSVDRGLLSRIRSLEREVSTDPANVTAWINLGDTYFDSDQYAKSIEAYKKAVELQPNNANVWTDMGIMYRRLGKPREAIKAFDRAIEADPRHEISRMNKGIVLLHDLGDEKGAIQAWEDLWKINPFATAPGGQSVAQMLSRMKNRQEQPGGAD